MYSFKVDTCVFVRGKKSEIGLLSRLSPVGFAFKLISRPEVYLFPYSVLSITDCVFLGRSFSWEEGANNQARGRRPTAERGVCVYVCVRARALCVIQLPLHTSLSQSVCVYEGRAFIQRLEKVFSQHRPLILS